jgi:hypothetical protein
MTSPTALALLLGFVGPPAAAGPSDTSFVAVEVRFEPSAVAPGGRGTVEVRFVPADDIHINADPPVSVRLDASPLHIPGGRLEVQTGGDGGSVDTGAPVRHEVLIAPNAVEGPATLTGEVIYYYCSDSEGWCRRAARAFSLPVLVEGDPRVGKTVPDR